MFAIALFFAYLPSKYKFLHVQRYFKIYLTCVLPSRSNPSIGHSLLLSSNIASPNGLQTYLNISTHSEVLQTAESSRMELLDVI
jgi:hypothetical protein